MKITKFVLISFLLSFSTFYSVAQTDPNKELFSVDNQKVTVGEFIRIYEKNNSSDPNFYTENSLREYLDLYIKFKQKVAEAKKQNIHTEQKIKNEIAGYRKELAKPYLLDQKAVDLLIKEAYERSKVELRVKHIFVRLPQYPVRKDTLLALEKIKKIRKRIVNGEPFDSVARATSDDPSASKNSGDLGYVTALSIPDYGFENQIYRAKINELSQPIRSSFGYHIIKVTNRRIASGEIRTAHLMLKHAHPDSIKQEAEIERRIFEIYAQATNGADFSELVKKYSEDKSTSDNFGELQWFGIGRMPFEYQEAAFALDRNGAISKPVSTKFGWHIIKRLDKREIPDFEAMKQELRTKIARDNRAFVSKQKLFDQLKKDYNYKQTSSPDSLYAAVDSTILEAKWDKSIAKNFNNTLITLGDTSVSESDFADFLFKNQYVCTTKKEIREYIDELFEKFVKKVVLDYEENHLEQKYPDFKLLIKEYFEGILLFEVSEKEVWAKAVKDSVGLQEYYLNNPNKYKSNAEIECRIFTYTAADDKSVLLKILKKAAKKNYSFDELNKYLNKNERIQYSGTEKFLSKEENNPEVIKNYFSNPDFSKRYLEDNTQNTIFEITNIQPAVLLEFEKVRGYVLSDYEQNLEQEWTKKLNEKYPAKINKKNLETLIRSKTK